MNLKMSSRDPNKQYREYVLQKDEVLKLIFDKNGLNELARRLAEAGFDVIEKDIYVVQNENQANVYFQEK